MRTDDATYTYTECVFNEAAYTVCVFNMAIAYTVCMFDEVADHVFALTPDIDGTIRVASDCVIGIVAPNTRHVPWSQVRLKRIWHYQLL